MAPQSALFPELSRTGRMFLFKDIHVKKANICIYKMTNISLFTKAYIIY